MGTLKKANPNAHELVTEILDPTSWWNVLSVIVEFLQSKGVKQVRLGIGFVPARDLETKHQAEDQSVQLGALEAAL